MASNSAKKEEDEDEVQSKNLYFLVKNSANEGNKRGNEGYEPVTHELPRLKYVEEWVPLLVTLQGVIVYVSSFKMVMG